ncbi:hypothetical protein [Streptomyces misionensis]|uniref:hypothetical protein n=1 Tax=Streptomyces misionensis TaxID=67331 RepID=UPI000942D8B5|nr:hypothetical protein [Streptomyces misionensis]
MAIATIRSKICSSEVVADAPGLLGSGRQGAARLDGAGAVAGDAVAAGVLVGAGTSLIMMPAVVAATSGIDPRDAGVASGLINMCRQLGAALGLAALVTVATTVTGHSDGSGDAAVVDGDRTAFHAVAALSLLGTGPALLLRTAQDDEGRPQPPDAA